MERRHPAVAFKIAASCARSACARATENRDRRVPRETFDEVSDANVGSTFARATIDSGDVVVEENENETKADEEQRDGTTGEDGTDALHGASTDAMHVETSASLLRDAHVGSRDGGAFEGDARGDDFAALAAFCVVRSFPPGARVFTRGAAATASLFVLAGALEHVEDEPSPGSKSSSESESSESESSSRWRLAGQWAGETPYLEFGDDDADDSDVGDADANRRRRRTDARADPREGCVAAVFSHAALDRLAEEKPGLAMAVLTRMARAATARRRRALENVLGENPARAPEVNELRASMKGIRIHERAYAAVFGGGIASRTCASAAALRRSTPPLRDPLVRHAGASRAHPRREGCRPVRARERRRRRRATSPSRSPSAPRRCVSARQSREGPAERRARDGTLCVWVGTSCPSVGTLTYTSTVSVTRRRVMVPAPPSAPSHRPSIVAASSETTPSKYASGSPPRRRRATSPSPRDRC